MQALAPTLVHAVVTIVGMKIRRISVSLPGELLDAAQNITGKGVAETLIEGLEQLKRRQFFERAVQMRGKVRLDINLDATRGRRRR